MSTMPMGAPRLRLRGVALPQAVVVAEPHCPKCQRRWMRWLLFDHRDNCSLRNALDATLAADHAALTGWSNVLLRPIRPAERVLATALAIPPAALPEGVEVTVRRLTPSVLQVWLLGTFDLDVLATADELAAALVSADLTPPPQEAA